MAFLSTNLLRNELFCIRTRRARQQLWHQAMVSMEVRLTQPIR
jgi:hypothetical protein